MEVPAAQVGKSLQKKLSPVYLICGDEILLRQECEDEIRQAVRGRGVEEREVWDVDRRFDWNQLLAANQSLSLFGGGTLFELRLSGGLDKNGSAALVEYCSNPGDNFLMLSCGNLDKRSRSAKWFQALDNSGVVVNVRPVDRRQLPDWIQQRFRLESATASTAACQLLADLVEGNLLAASQEVRRLAVVAGGAEISAELVQESVASSARYSVFQAVDEALAGHAARSLKMLDNLYEEGADTIPLLGAVNLNLRQLTRLSLQRDGGEPLNRVLNHPSIWKSKQSLYRGALERLPTRSLKRLLQQCENIDRCSRGLADGNPRLLMARLFAELAGVTLFSGR